MAQEIVSVAASADDAWESEADASFTSTSGELRTRSSASVQLSCGMRFVIPNIASGDTIDGATVDVLEVGNLDMHTDIHCEDVDDADDFSTNADLVNRTRTTASVLWQATLNNNTPTTSPDFKTVVQEVVDRAGWAAGNALLVYLKGIASDPNELAFIEAYDDAGTDEAEITIDYTAGGAAGLQVGSLALMGVGK